MEVYKKWNGMNSKGSKPSNFNSRNNCEVSSNYSHSETKSNFSYCPKPEQNISKVIEKNKNNVRETTNLKVNFAEQQRSSSSKAQNDKMLYREQVILKSTFEKSSDNNNDDGWITVKSNKSNLKKKENLQTTSIISNKLSRPNYNKFNSKQTSDFNEVNINPGLKISAKHNTADFGKGFRELNKSNNLEPKMYKLKNFEKRTNTGTQNILHSSLPNGSSKKNVKNIVEKKEHAVILKDREIYEVPKESEEKIQARLLKKLKLKEDKKRMREEKAMLLRDKLRRDTKVNWISQEMIEKFSKSSVHESASNQYKYYRASNSEEYPAINGIGASRQNHYNEKFSHYQSTKDIQNNNINSSKQSKMTSSISYSSAARNMDRSHVIDFVSENKLLDKANSSHFVESTIGIKKKLKSKDRMNLAIISLLEMKQREKKNNGKIKLNVEQKPVKPIVERQGKIRENAKKRLSALKKNIQMEKKRREELLFSILKETSEYEKNVNHPNESEPNLAALDINSSGNVDSDEPSAPPNEICSQSSISPKILSKNLNLSNSNEENKEMSSSDLNTLVDNIASDNEKFLNSTHKIENSSIIKEINLLMHPVHSKRFREYCDQIVTPEINEALSILLQLLVKFQDRHYRQDSSKAVIKRRFFCGLKETMKHMKTVVCIIMAPNLKPSPGPGCVDELVMKILDKATESGIPIVFGLTNSLIGRLCHKKVPVSCLSIVNYHGAQESFNELMDLIPEAKTEYLKLLVSRGIVDSKEDNTDISHEENVSSSDVTDLLLRSLKVKEETV